ncbi:MAG: response regulator [Deltaproteobacteria bacterium]|nr:response regulator [Deltaproteobacteria bacterium]
MSAPKIKILVVEDSAAMRSLVASTVESIPGVEVVESDSGFEALRLLPREPVDLIITDINMPGGINGLELINFVKKNPRYKHVPLIVISTEGTDRDREKGMKLGADAYLIKPFEPDDLVAEVERLLVAGAP